MTATCSLFIRHSTSHTDDFAKRSRRYAKRINSTSDITANTIPITSK
jgi:hypothetical protein